jgi:hypothetical protein
VNPFYISMRVAWEAWWQIGAGQGAIGMGVELTLSSARAVGTAQVDTSDPREHCTRSQPDGTEMGLPARPNPPVQGEQLQIPGVLAATTTSATTPVPQGRQKP